MALSRFYSAAASLAALTLSAAVATAAPPPMLHVDGAVLKDPQGRVAGWTGPTT